MESERNLYLSVVTFIQDQLTDEGWTDVTVVDRFPVDDKIVMPDDSTGDADEVVLPAISIEEGVGMPEDRVQLGGTQLWTDRIFHIFIYAQSRGQEIDLRSFLKNTLHDYDATLYDYTSSGWPSDAATETGDIFIERITNQPTDTFSENAALRNSGMITFTAQAQRSQGT